MSSKLTPNAALAVVFVAAASLSLPVLAQSDAQTPASAESVVRLDAFEVSTAIGSYHEETSSMATKVPTNLKELSSSLEILNASALADRNATSLTDVYSYVVGVSQSQPNTDGFTFRGIPSAVGSFTQNIEYDGLMGGIFNHSALSATNVEDLEFLKGPNSVLYGQMRPGGLLNIVSKSPQPDRQETLKVYFGTYAGTYNSLGSTNSGGITLDATGPIDQGKHWLYRLIVNDQDNHPYRPGDYDKQVQIYPSLTYKWNADAYFTVKVEYGQERRRYDDGLVPLFTSATAYGTGAHYMLPPLNTMYQEPTDVSRDKGEVFATEFQKRWNDNWTFRVQTRSVWHTDAVRDLDTNNTSIFIPKASFATPASLFSRQYNSNINGHRYNYFDANSYGSIGPDQFRNTVIVGIGGGLEFYNNQRWAFGPNVLPAISPFNPILGQSAYPSDGTKSQSPRDTLTSLGEYVSDQIRIYDRVHVTVGTRHDTQESHGFDPFNPVSSPYIRQFIESWTSQAGAVVDLTKVVSIYGSWSQSVAPNVVTSVDATGHAGFPAEKGLQYEGGFKFENSSHTFFGSIAGYWINRSNVLVGTGVNLASTGQAIFRLDGEQHSEGVEVEFDYQPKPYWQIQGGVALGKAFVAASAKNPQTIGLDLVNAPRESGNLWNRFNVPHGAFKGLGLGTGLVYTSKSWGGDPTTVVYFPVTGFARVDAALYYKWKRYDLAFNVQNLLDRKYILSAQTPTLLVPGDARKLTFSIATKF